MSKLLKAAMALALAAFISSCDKLPELLYGTSGSGGDDAVEETIIPRKTTLEAEEGSMFVAVTASGKWTLDTEYPSGVDPWVTLDPAEGTDSKGDIRFRYTENPGESRSVTLVLATSRGVGATAVIKQIGRDEQQQSVGQYGYDVPTMDWLELPACKAGDGRDVLVHSMAGGKYTSKGVDGTRNWSCYWDYDEHLSLWVAYPLNKSLRGSGNRTNTWGYDALLPVSIQPNIVQGSYGGGWTRGHQIPSADRLKPESANISTFVPTNMTPQDYDFNCGIWANLEQAVRNYSDKSDTLYVVTGCLFDNSSTTSGGKSGFYVKIPTYYFKALLYRGSQSAAKDTKGYMAAGFLLPHTSNISGGNYLEYIMSIDQLEEKTGIDFFPNLVSVAGKDTSDAVESTVLSWWK